MTDIQEKLWDLLPIIRRNVYHHAFEGSFSLKYVLPALVPDMSHEDMTVGDGMEAGIAWKKMISAVATAEEKNRLKRVLLDYCGQDTIAMVRLVETLRSVGIN